MISDIRKERTSENPVSVSEEWLLKLPNGDFYEKVVFEKSRLIVPARHFLETYHPQMIVGWQNGRVTWSHPESQSKVHRFDVVKLDKNGAAWIKVRDVADSYGLGLKVEKDSSGGTLKNIAILSSSK
jgi:hypothetical protein